MNTPRKPDERSGYAEKTPRDRKQAQQPEPRAPRNPDEGGLDRDPEPEVTRDDTD
ncbi:hypothetical protein [Luteimonas sp. e5]